MRPWIFPLAAAALAAACGKNEAPAAKPARPAAATTTAAAAAEAAPDCPPPKSAAPAGPDVIGVRLGMTRDEAINVVRCQSPQARLSKSDRWVDRLDTHGQKLGAQQFSARSGVTEPCDYKKFALGEMQRCEGNIMWKKVTEVVTVATPGVPGQEKVQGMWRTQRFADGEMPTVAAAVEALQAKYGAGGVRRNPTQPASTVTLAARATAPARTTSRRWPKGRRAGAKAAGCRWSRRWCAAARTPSSRPRSMSASPTRAG